MPPVVLAAGIMGGTSLLSTFMGKKNNNNKQADASLQLQQEQAQKQSNLSNTISEFAKRQHSMADPAIQKAMAYYSQLAGGGKGGLQAAIAPNVSMINENYRGAERGMMARMAPGGVRDQALGDLYRQRVGQIAGVGQTARQNAIGNLGSMGMDLMGQGNSAFGMAGNTLSGAASSFGNVANSYQNKANQNANMWGSVGNSIGSILMPYLLGGGGSGGGPLPSGRVNIPGMFGNY